MTAKAFDASDLAMPPSAPGMRIGIFGGSFNPPHEGHLQVAETAMQRLRLHRLWWMVTPGNPLKDHGALRPLAERIAASRDLVRDRRILVTGFEAGISTRFTADTLIFVRHRRPGVRFVWVMGADSLATFHRWDRWRDILETMPIAVVDRPRIGLAALASPAARTAARFRVAEADAAVLPELCPAWTFLHGPLSAVSSTQLRAASPAAVS